MGKRKDWTVDGARNVADIVLQPGISREIAVNYIASALRMAHQRGSIEATKVNGAVPPKPKAAPEKLV